MTAMMKCRRASCVPSPVCLPTQSRPSAWTCRTPMRARPLGPTTEKTVLVASRQGATMSTQEYL
eukprot:3862716-Pyramimonas_sp.AAC.1